MPSRRRPRATASEIPASSSAMSSRMGRTYARGLCGPQAEHQARVKARDLLSGPDAALPSLRRHRPAQGATAMHDDDPTITRHETQAPREALTEALYEVKRVIVGQDEMLERLVVALLAGGHVLLEGVPGLAKTLTVKTL